MRHFCNPLLPKRHLFVIFALLGAATLASGAEIRGRVYDSTNAIYLEGARVVLRETGAQTTSERSGYFSFGGLDAGIYTVTASAVGYPQTSKTVSLSEDVNVTDLVIDIGDETVFEMEAFEVTGSVVGTAKALNQQRTADNLQSIVSSDAFGQFVDRNAAEALQRLPGVTVEDSQGEGKYLIIRGANPTWSTVSIDGIELATPDENGRSIGLNIITVDQLESVEVTKSWTPDMKAGFVGGNVNMKTRSALDSGRMFASIEGAYGFYDISEEESWRGSATFGDVWEFGSGKRALAFQVSVNQSEDNRGSDSLTHGWSLITDYPLDDAPWGLAVSSTDMEDYRIKRERIGVSSKVEFRIAPGHVISASISYNKFDDKEIVQEANLSSPISPVNFRGNARLTEAIAIQLGLDPESPEVASRINSTDNWELRFEESIAIGETAYDWDTRTYTYGKQWDGSIGRRFEHNVTNDEILTYSLGGVHNFSSFFKAEWKAYSTEADKTNQELGLSFGGRQVTTIRVAGDDPEVARLFLPGEHLEYFTDPESYYITRTLGTLLDNSYHSTDQREGGDLDLTYILDVGSANLSTRIGASYDARDKSYNRDFSRLSGNKILDRDLYPNGELRLSQVDLYAGQLDDFLYDYGSGDGYEFGPSFDDQRMLDFFEDPASYGIEFGQNNSDVTYQVTNAVLRDYLATEDILGAYFMETFDWKGWTLILGVRYEETENSFTNNEIITRTETGAFIRPSSWPYRPVETYSQPVTSTKKYDHWLPAVHLKKTFGEDWVFRASVTKTLTRPLFTDLVPSEIPSFTSSYNFSTSVELPNFELRPMESVNYDLSLQKYFENVGYLNVSVFYKDLDGAIYDETREVEPGEETRPYYEKYDSLSTDPNHSDNDRWNFSRKANTGAGQLYGIELAFDRNFDFLGTWAEDFGFSTNFTLMESEVELTLKERLGEKVPLFKQPDSIFNFSIFYETKKIFARLSYNLRGKYLQSVRGGSLVKELEGPQMELTPDALDTWVDDYGRLDFNIRWKVTKHFQIFAEITNITNEPIQQFRGSEIRPTLVRYTGPIYFIGAKWNL